MTLRDFSILFLCCLFWGVNFVLSKWVIADLQIPPLFFAALRFALVLALLFPFLRPIPSGFTRLLLVGLLVGPVHLSCLYIGLKTATASSASLVAQMLIPFTIILSVLFLKEKIGAARGTAITVAFIGILILILDPSSLRPDPSLLLIGFAYFAVAVASILIKGIGEVSPYSYVAWMAAMAVPLLGGLSFVTETGQWEMARAAGWYLAAALVYVAVLTSIFSHGQYFRLLKTYDVTLVVPITLMAPFWAVMLGVGLRGEPFGPRIIIGGVLILASVYVLARRPSRQ